MDFSNLGLTDLLSPFGFVTSALLCVLAGWKMLDIVMMILDHIHVTIS